MLGERSQSSAQRTLIFISLSFPSLPIIDIPLRHRHILHGIIILLAVIAPILGIVRFRIVSPRLDAATASLPTVYGKAEAGDASLQFQYLHSPPLVDTYKPPVLPAKVIETVSREFVAVSGESVAVELPATIAEPKGRQEIIDYKVADGDTLLDLANRFNLSVDTLIWANELGDGNYLEINQTLRILPVDGVLHEVKEGDTLESIATKYKVTTEAIASFEPNHLVDSTDLAPGQEIIVPGAELDKKWRPMPVPRGGPRYAWSIAGGVFQWPTYGEITQYFHPYHRGVDIAPPEGSPIRAAAPGTVVEAQKLSWSYGWYLLIDHGNGYSSMYGHCSRFYVGVGEYVDQGQLIALVGNTGKSTGPHLHFEIRRNGLSVNPLSYLP